MSVLDPAFVSALLPERRPESVVSASVVIVALLESVMALSISVVPVMERSPPFRVSVPLESASSSAIDKVPLVTVSPPE
ncbi:hypothetical protein ACQZV8_19365 [Magnetococcales bacterium HHB-1]